MVGLTLFCITLALTTHTFLQVNAATTAIPGNHTHHHHEQTETENFSFHYDGSTHLLLVLKDTKCYIWSLTHKQLQTVHTDEGLRAIELKVLNDIDQALYTVVPMNILANSIQHGCGKHVSSVYLVH